MADVCGGVDKVDRYDDCGNTLGDNKGGGYGVDGVGQNYCKSYKTNDLANLPNLVTIQRCWGKHNKKPPSSCPTGLMTVTVGNSQCQKNYYCYSIQLWMILKPPTMIIIGNVRFQK